MIVGCAAGLPPGGDCDPAAVTVKASGNVTTSEPVVSVTGRALVAAVASMRIPMDALVALLTCTLSIVMPGPKFAVVMPDTQCVFSPTT